MKLFALVFALLIEQLRPLRPGNRIRVTVSRFADVVRANFDAGEASNGAVGWWVFMLICLVAALIAQTVAEINGVLLFALHLFVLSGTIGFRQFSEAFSEIRVALAADDADGARRILAGWLEEGEHRGVDAAALYAREAGAEAGTHDDEVSRTCRLSIAHALLASHRSVLGPLFCYVLLPGIVGPVLYRAAEMLARRWRNRVEGGEARSGSPTAVQVPPERTLDPDGFGGHRVPCAWGSFAVKAFAWIDWIPVRLSATAFAIVGNFDDALYWWRGATSAGLRDARSVLLAAASGALGIRLLDAQAAELVTGLPIRDVPVSGPPQGAPKRPVRSLDGSADEAHTESLRAAARLVWRALVLCLAVLGLFTVAAWMG